MAGACESDFLDVNTSPNASSAADPGLLFTNSIVDYSTNRTIDFGPTGLAVSQLFSGGGSLGAGVFTQPERYIISTNVNGNTWRSHYRNEHKNLKLAIDIAEAADPVQNNAAAQCKIFRAMIFWSTTLIWGDAPFSEAVNPEFDLPNFDPQEQVLNGVLSMLDEAIAQMDESSPLAITNNDLIFNGDMAKWRKFAKSLKFRTLMTMVDADPSKATEIGALIAEGDMISSPLDNARFPFFSVSGNRNPFWETLNAFAGGQNFFYFASKAMVDLMKSKSDPRLRIYFEPYPGGDPASEVVGVPPGGDASPSVHWVLSTAPTGTDGTVELVRPAAPDVLFSYQEQLFLEAEAIARGFATGDADAKMREGISVAMLSYGIDAADIDAYLAGIPTATVQVIAEEAWVDLVVRPLEGWTHWRRTEVNGVGYPNLQLPDGAQTGNLMRRFPLPPDEVAANTNAPTQRPLDEKMWFDI
ncbi:MAG: hypothetical protein DHS20C17_01570 [Cyclobacteriaceae bacterium]|nr:MAG: hypothetical protein DHS20C17_01570 [Cyclobacteriaceae bacterium]